MLRTLHVCLLAGLAIALACGLSMVGCGAEEAMEALLGNGENLLGKPAIVVTGKFKLR